MWRGEVRYPRTPEGDWQSWVLDPCLSDSQARALSPNSWLRFVTVSWMQYLVVQGHLGYLTVWGFLQIHNLLPQFTCLEYLSN